MPAPHEAQTAMPVSKDGPLTIRGGVVLGLFCPSFARVRWKTSGSIRVGTGISMMVDGSY
jgi:hypothetical protein